MDDQTSLETEQIIFENLHHSEEYTRFVLPYIKPEYFQEEKHRVYFETFLDLFIKYDKIPSPKIVTYTVKEKRDLQEEVLDQCEELAKSCNKKSEVFSNEWLIDTTEKFCQDKALYNALMESINIADGNNKKLSATAIPDIMSTALGVSFDTHLGHDYFEDAQARYDWYNSSETKYPTNLSIINDITNGGVEAKTLNCILAGTGVGKSLMLCNLAAHYLVNNYNVLYITCEMDERKISQRIDANLLNITLNEVVKLPQKIFIDSITKIKSRTQSRLKVKEYPAGTANTNHFKALLTEYKQKHSFMPDVIMVDYLNICASARLKSSDSSNSYGYVKSIAEELRALAQELELPIWTATQSNRGGQDNSDMDITNTSESMGLPHTLDFFLGMIRTDELAAMGQILCKQLKTRYGDINYKNKFCIGFDVNRMKTFDIEDHAQDDIIQSTNIDDVEPEFGGYYKEGVKSSGVKQGGTAVVSKKKMPGSFTGFKF